MMGVGCVFGPRFINENFVGVTIVQTTLCKRCFPLRGQLKGQKGKTIETLSFFMLPNIWASCDKISLNLNYSFDV